MQFNDIETQLIDLKLCNESANNYMYILMMKHFYDIIISFF